ncbi:Hypothetical predicted protein [Pelobates cultripes]|uniref:Uncharacterized protein n=1 Tax=Pelobates cultripes TaxID=61616 RepID=A0AAD1SL44_PELCU|nr:Hypothetical predicted protein [Pelobates cultripes]
MITLLGRRVCRTPSIPASPGSSIAGSSRGTSEPAALSQISLDRAVISSSMLTRRDKSEMVAELRALIREEIAAVRADLTALEHRQAVDLAITRQGNLLLDLRRQVEDLDNRGRRNNIRILGLPEAEGELPHELLTGLFSHLLGEAAPEDFGIERAHRALRTPRRDGVPRDLICALASFPLKEELMKAARSRPDLRYMDAPVALYHDLSQTTLDARRALRPLTRLLQERRIPYKWGFAFSLQARVGNMWHMLQWPNDVPRNAGLPHIAIPNWILVGPPARAVGPEEAAHNLHLELELPRRRGGPNGPEE